jgi:RNA polymerase sigma-70 factor (ECF subfamily)
MNTLVMCYGSIRAIPQEGWMGWTAMAENAEEHEWLKEFHAGEKRVLAAVYQENYDAAVAAVSNYLRGPDAETVVQDLFVKMVADQAFRENYQGGSLRAWLATVARNRAIDFLRKHRREQLTEDGDVEGEVSVVRDQSFVGRMEARQIIERFRKAVLPEKWRDVFEARFMRQLTQREAAADLKMPRTTIAYQEIRIRKILQDFLLDLEGES